MSSLDDFGNDLYEEDMPDSNRRKFLRGAGLGGLGAYIAGFGRSYEKSNPNLESITEASYIVFKDDKNVYAKNGRTGKLDYKGRDASKLIQAAINSLGIEGGRIFIKKGEYSNVAVTVDATKVPRISIVGENRYSTILNGDGKNALIHLDGMRHRVGIPHAYIGHIQLKNNDACCLNAERAGMGVLENSYLYNTGTSAPTLRIATSSHWFTVDKSLIRGGAHGIALLDDSNHVRIFNSRVTDASENGILLDASSDHTEIVSTDISGNGAGETYGCGIKIVDSKNNDIIGCYLEHNKYTNILLQGEPGNPTENNKIIGGKLGGAVTHGIYMGHANNTKIRDVRFGTWDIPNHILISANAKFTYIQNPYPRIGDLAISDSGTNTHYEQYYATKNSGIAKGTSPITVEHGLAQAPKFVQLTPKGSKLLRTSYEADEKKIKIYHDGDLEDIAWYAEV